MGFPGSEGEPLTRTGSRTVAGNSFEVEEAIPYNLFYREGDRVVRFSAEMTSPESAASIIVILLPA